MASPSPSIFSSLALFAVLLGGCDGDASEASPDTTENAERGRISKADGLAGTCNLRCGADYDETESCQCDDECLEIGDCCGDYVDLCEPDVRPDDVGTCSLRCGSIDFSQACQCDSDCSEYGDCCDDYETWCEEPTFDPQDEPGDDSGCDPDLICTQALTCIGGELYPTGCGAANCDAPVGDCGPSAPTCDASLICTQALTCVDGQLYPTGCGPANCDAPMGPCGGGGDSCDDGLICEQVLTCVGGELYPTSCGAANCDAPLGPCGGDADCDPGLLCEQVLTCIDGELWPTPCGGASCDVSLGAC